MQLGRNYYRRLKSVKYDIYELYLSARHAYNTVRPAVKTSRPLGVSMNDGGLQRYIKNAIFALRLPKREVSFHKIKKYSKWLLPLL